MTLEEIADLRQAAQGAIDRVREADDRAYASQLAFALGAERFRQHVEKMYDVALREIENRYGSTTA